MPELPEVETVRRGLAPAMEGARLSKVVLNRPDLRFPFPKGFEEKLQELQKHTKSFEGFQKRFFRWFNAFLIMKFIHFARDKAHPDVSVTEAAIWLLEQLGHTPSSIEDRKILLLQYRELT